jgi:hypothetical protein
MTAPLNPSHTAAAARRERYYEARRAGLGIVDAGNAAGASDPSTFKRYERWYKAVESGAEMLTRPGRQPMTHLAAVAVAAALALAVILAAASGTPHGTPQPAPRAQVPAAP